MLKKPKNKYQNSVCMNSWTRKIMSNLESDANPVNLTDEAPSVMSIAKLHVVCSCAIKAWGACDTHSDLESRTQKLPANSESLYLDNLKVPPVRFYYYKTFPAEDQTIFHFFLPSDDDIQGEVEEAARIIQLKLPSSEVIFCPPFSALSEGFRNMQIRVKSGSMLPEISTIWNKARNDRVPPAKPQSGFIPGVQIINGATQRECLPQFQRTNQSNDSTQYLVKSPTDGTKLVISYDPNGFSKSEKHEWIYV